MDSKHKEGMKKKTEGLLQYRHQLSKYLELGEFKKKFKVFWIIEEERKPRRKKLKKDIVSKEATRIYENPIFSLKPTNNSDEPSHKPN